MARATDKAARKNGHKAKPVVSKLGKDLRRIREKVEASGEKFILPLYHRSAVEEIGLSPNHTWLP